MRITRSQRIMISLVLALVLAIAGGPLLAGCSRAPGGTDAANATTGVTTAPGQSAGSTGTPATDASGQQPSASVRSTQIPDHVPSGPLRIFCTPRATLNPLQDSNASFQTISSLVYEGLFGIDSTRQAVPVLAEPESTTQDTDSYSLTLRLAENRRFHDGSPVRAQDAAASFAAIQAAGPASAYAGRLPDVAAITAVDERTLMVTLTRPQPDIAWQLTFPVLPAAALAAAASNPLAILPGTGPYRITAYTAGQGLTLQADETGSRGRDARVRTIEAIELPGTHEALRAFERDGIDLVAIPSTAYPAHALRNGLKLERYATNEYLFLSFRTAEGALLANPNRLSFVQAASQSPEMASGLETLGVQPAAVPIHPDNPLWRATSLTDPGYLALYQPGTTARPDAAQSVPAYPATRQALVILAPQEDTLRATIATRLAAVLAARGVAATASVLPLDAYQAARIAGQYDILVAQAVTTGSADPRWLMGQAPDPGVAGSELLPRTGSGGYPTVSTAVDRLFTGGTAAAADQPDLLSVLGEAARLGPYTGIGFRYAALASGSRILGQPRPQASALYEGIEDLWLWST